MRPDPRSKFSASVEAVLDQTIRLLPQKEVDLATIVTALNRLPEQLAYYQPTELERQGIRSFCIENLEGRGQLDAARLVDAAFGNGERPPDPSRPAQRQVAVDGKPLRKRPVIVRMQDVQPELVSWLWQDRIPLGKLTLLDGDPGLGKSTIMFDLAARVSTGAQMPDDSPGLSGGVVILTAEDGLADTVVPRLNAAGANLDRIVVLKAVHLKDVERPPSIPEDLDAVQEAIAMVDAKLVIVDPLVAYLSGDVNSWRDQDVRRSLHPLANLADEMRIALVAIRHLTKGSGGHAVYRGGGSIGIIGAARSGLLVAKDPDDETGRVLAVVKSNLAPEAPSLSYHIETAENATSRIVWGGESPHSANALVAAFGDPEEQTALGQAKTFLLEELADGPRPAKEIQRTARDAGIADRTLKRARHVLAVESYRAGFGPGGTWMLALPKGANYLPKIAVKTIEGQVGLYTESGPLCEDERRPGESIRAFEERMEREGMEIT